MKLAMHDDDIVRRTREAFAMLARHFGFEPPEAERRRHELRVRYHRGPETISIFFDATDAPMIELFLPVEGTSDPAIPWAARNGVRRYRRFSDVRVSEPWNPRDAVALGGYLDALANAFVVTERQFLERIPGDSPSAPRDDSESRR